jgi:hypothetical protein
VDKDVALGSLALAVLGVVMALAGGRSRRVRRLAGLASR